MSYPSTVLTVPHRATPHRTGPLHRAPLPVCPADRLQLVLALCCGLTGTPWGTAMSLVVLLLLVARRRARRALGRSAAVRVGALAASQHADPLDASGQRRQATAGA